jgi:N-acetylneuraminic acid mutarotase
MRNCLTALAAAVACVLGLAATSVVCAQQAQGRWTTAATLPGVRSELQAIGLGGKIYAIGGNSVTVKDGKPEIVPDSGINQVYDPATDSWRTLAPVPMGANHRHRGVGWKDLCRRRIHRPRAHDVDGPVLCL